MNEGEDLYFPEAAENPTVEAAEKALEDAVARYAEDNLLVVRVSTFNQPLPVSTGVSEFALKCIFAKFTWLIVYVYSSHKVSKSNTMDKYILKKKEGLCRVRNPYDKV